MTVTVLVPLGARPVWGYWFGPLHKPAYRLVSWPLAGRTT